MSYLEHSCSVHRDWLIRSYLVIWVCGRLIGLFVLSLLPQSFYLYLIPSSVPYMWWPVAPLSTFLQCGNRTMIRMDCLAPSELGNYTVYLLQTPRLYHTHAYSHTYTYTQTCIYVDRDKVFSFYISSSCLAGFLLDFPWRRAASWKDTLALKQGEGKNVDM